MKIIKTSLMTIVAALALTSCDSGDPKQTVQYGYDNNITYVTDRTDNTTATTEAAYYIMDFDVISGKANVDISNLRLTAGGSPIRLRSSRQPTDRTKRPALS